MKVSIEQIKEIKRLFRSNMTTKQISQMLNIPRSTLERYTRPVKIHNKKTLTPSELRRYNDGILENYENINSLRRFLRSIKIGDQLEISIKVYTGYEQAKRKIYTSKVEQKTDHVIVVALDNGKHVSISDYELLTKEATIRKVS